MQHSDRDSLAQDAAKISGVPLLFHSCLNVRRRIVLITPLLVLAIVNATLLLGQTFCNGRAEGICSDSVPIFQPTAHLNRTMRFVLFLALVQWFQHAALDVFLHLGLTTGSVEQLVAPKRLPNLGNLCAADADKYEEWAQMTWDADYAAPHHRALEARDTHTAWRICENFDAACLEARLDAAGIEERRIGGAPRRTTMLPAERRAGRLDPLWRRFVQWLEALFLLTSPMRAPVLPTFGLKPYGEWIISGALASCACSLRCPVTSLTTQTGGKHCDFANFAWMPCANANCKKWVGELTPQRLHGPKRCNPQLFACKQLKGQLIQRTMHLVDDDSQEVVTAVGRMHDILWKTWQPLFRLHGSSAEPSWCDFEAEYREELDGWRAVCPMSPAVDALDVAVRARGRTKVGGPDNWAIHEGHALPSVSLAYTGLFSNWAHAVVSGKGALPRFVSFSLLVVLMPCSTLRLAAWLLQPAGSGVVRRTLGGLVPHHVADSALVTAWCWWSLLAVSVVMQPQLIGLTGFTLRCVSRDVRWKHLTMLFKYTLFFWLAVHFLRGCVAHGFAAAQTDLITISFLYPLLLCFIWTVPCLRGLGSGAFSRFFWTLVGSLLSLPVVFLLSTLGEYLRTYFLYCVCMCVCVYIYICIYVQIYIYIYIYLFVYLFHYVYLHLFFLQTQYAHVLLY
ncbi:unnamed protein product [Symbiodinium sp. KB8]|nr:unnamed protein product [Symbiodinium sp. KB8]